MTVTWIAEEPVVVWMPKPSCPRDRGVWYCDECRERHTVELTLADDYLPRREGCDRVFGDKVCGGTHQGFEWCDECKAAGRIELDLHIGEFVSVAGRRSDEDRN